MSFRPLIPFLLLIAAGTPLAATAEAPPPATAAEPSGAATDKPAPADEPAAARTSVAPPLSPRMRQVRERIDVLFAHRNAPVPPLIGRHNPFRPPGAAPDQPPPIVDVASATGVPDAAEVATSDLALLQRAVATLKVNGIFEIGGRQHLVVNSRPYTDGDVIQTVLDGATVYLRVRQVSRKALTLSLNGAEMALKF